MAEIICSSTFFGMPTFDGGVKEINLSKIASKLKLQKKKESFLKFITTFVYI